MINIPQDLKGIQSYKYRKKVFHFVEYTTTSEISNNEVIASENAIVYILEGKKEVKIANNIFTVEAGELFFLQKGKYVMSEYIPKTGESFKSIMLFFNYNHISDIIENLYSKERQINLYTSSTINQLPIFGATQRIENYYKNFIQDMNSLKDDFFAKELLDLKIKELMYILLSDRILRKETIRFLISIGLSTKKSLTRIVQESIYKNISVENLALMCNMSTSTFKREFKKTFELSPMQWIVNKKLDRAVVLLKTTDKYVQDIAYECGFENYIHFSRRFKARFGKSAIEFRAKV